MSTIKYYALKADEEVPCEFVVIKNTNGEPEFCASFVNTDLLSYENGVLLTFHERNNELRAENAKLRGEVEKWERLTANIELPEYPVTQFHPKDLERENAKLRELVSDMWRFTGTACKKYPRLFDPSAQGGQMVQPNALDSFEQRMEELGIEAAK